MKKQNPMNDGRATISDVASMAGVSAKTVSRVANGEPNVREQTRARVQRAIDALGYRPNPYAQYLSSLRRLAGQPRAETTKSDV